MKRFYDFLSLTAFIFILLLFSSCSKNENTIAPEAAKPDPPALSSPADDATGVELTPTLSWNASESAASYTLQVSLESSFLSTQFMTFNQSGLTGTSQQVTGLNNLKKYFWRVNAMNSAGTSGWSSTRNFTVKPETLQPPTLTYPQNGVTDVDLPPTLYWDGPGATSFTLQVSANAGFSSFIYNQSGLAANAQQMTGLDYSTKYYWRVNSTNSYETSGWSTVSSFTTTTAGGGPCPGTPTVTYGGKVYNTILIGSQCWLKENLDVGSGISGSSSQTDNGIIEKYCYGDIAANCDTYGGLYQWNEAMQYSTSPGAQGICPSGWHIPTSEDFSTLITYVNSSGNALKKIGQGSGDGAGTNTSGFSALLGGWRTDSGTFGGLGNVTDYWASSPENAFTAWIIEMTAFVDAIDSGSGLKLSGHSVRCIKD